MDQFSGSKRESSELSIPIEGLNLQGEEIFKKEIPDAKFSIDTNESADILPIQQALSFTPLIWETLDLIQKNSELALITKAGAGLGTKFKEALQLIQELPGVDMSLNDQQSAIQKDIHRCQLKREQFQKYIQLPLFRQELKRALAVDDSEVKRYQTEEIETVII